MENRGVLKQCVVANPLFAGTIAGVMGAFFGFWIHGVSVDPLRIADEKPFVLGFTILGIVIGFTVSYCSYVKQRLRCRLTFCRPSDPVGSAPFVHAALAGAILFFSGSVILYFTFQFIMRGQSGGESSPGVLVGVIDGFFSFGGRMLVNALGIDINIIHQIRSHEDPIHTMIELVYVPAANGVIGALCGLFVAGCYRLHISA